MSLLGDLARILLRIRGNLILLEMKNPPCKIYLPDDSIWALIREIYMLEAYPSFESLKGTVIDAGAHAGSFAIPASFFADRVIAVEPNPFVVKILELNAIINGRKNVDILPYALYQSSKTFFSIPTNLPALWVLYQHMEKIKLRLKPYPLTKSLKSMGKLSF